MKPQTSNRKLETHNSKPRVGLGFRNELSADIFLNRDKIGFLEIIADHYIDAGKRKMDELEVLKGHFPLIPHGINLSLGSADGIDDNYLAKLRDLIRFIDPPYWSEHIAYTRIGNIDIGHLSPLPHTQQSLDTLCRNIEKVQRVIQVPLALENITYTIKLPGEEMDEVEFLNAVMQRTGCGLLMDVTNLFINAHNHKYSVSEFLDRLMTDRIMQLHFVGGELSGDEYSDTHGQRTQQEIWNVMEEVFKRTKVQGVILERDANYPPFQELLDELAIAVALGKKYAQWP